MAEEALKKLEEQLNCSICLDTYTDPKLLQCFHVYCRQCLVPLVVRDQQGQLGLTCPTCRQVTPVPDRGVIGLQSAFHINRFLEIQETLQKLDNPVAKLEKAAKGFGVENQNLPCKEVLCLDHDEELKLYCETCGELVCIQCIMKDGKHHDHECTLLKTAFERYKDEITSSLEPMEKQVAIIKDALAQFDTRYEEISDQRVATEESIHITFRRFQEILNVRKTELISQLDEMTDEKLKGLAAQRDQIETTLAQLNSCYHYMRESLKTGNEGDVLTLKPNTMNRVKELTSPFKLDFLKPRTEADIIFCKTSGDMTTTCRNYGQVCIPSCPDPSKCHITSTTAEVTAMGEMSTVILQSVNFEGKPCEKRIKSLECEFVSEITRTRASCSVKTRGKSQYEISYQPNIKGRHQLHIKAESQHIRGSPFGVSVKSLVQFSTPILTIGSLRGPWGIALNQRGELVVSERGLHCVSVFSPSGEKLRSFGKFGFDKAEFQGPHAVAVDGDENILVADEGNHRIQKFTAEGRFLAAVGTKGSGCLRFHHPSDIAFNASNGMVYVVDKGNDRIQVLNSDLTFSSTFGKEGSGKGQFRSPCIVACDNMGKVYVVDKDNHRIQVFTAEGKFLRMFGRRGQGRRELDYPIYLAIDTSGAVYVSESSNDCVSVFNPEGQFVTSFGRSGSGPGEFNCPRGLVVDDCGVVYVCDCDNYKVQVF